MAFTLETFIETNPNNPLDDSTNDFVNFWVSQSVITGVSASHLLGMTIATGSATNGTMTRYVEEADRVIMEFYKTDDYTPPESTYIGWYNIPIRSIKKQPSYYYIQFTDPIRIPSSSVALFDANDDINLFPFFTLAFDPSNEVKFGNGPFDVRMNNFNTSRRSKFILKVDREVYSPKTGIYQGLFLPANFETISASFDDNIRSQIPERAFSQIQDSNYETLSWSDIRYNGVVEDNNGSLGNEPALVYQKFPGVIFSSGSSDNTIRTFFSASLTQIDSQDIYFVNLGAPSSTGKGYSSTFFNNGTPVDLQYNLFTGTPRPNEQSSTFKTYLYEESPDNPNRLIKIVNSKVYSIDTSKIFNTDNLGKITNS